MRGLAHPVLFRGAGTGGGGFGAVPGAMPQGGGGPGAGGAGGGGGGGENFFEKFGAVPVTGRNAAKLLRRGDAVLLFPGGIKETIPAAAEDKYRLMWPDRSEFVRLAAKYNATIVPFGAVGAAEALSVVASVEVRACAYFPLCLRVCVCVCVRVCVCVCVCSGATSISLIS